MKRFILMFAYALILSTFAATADTVAEQLSSVSGRGCSFEDTICQAILAFNPSLQLTRPEEPTSSKNFPACSAEDLSCSHGNLCADTSNGLRCVQPLQEGDTCIHPGLTVCASGLECINNRCSPVHSVGSACILHADKKCMAGTYCVGKTHKFCTKPMALGDSCGTDQYSICEPTDICSHYRCVNRLKLGDVCDWTQDKQYTYTLCPPNSVCMLNGDQHRCTSLQRPDLQQWMLFAANDEGYVFHNGKFVGGVHGWRHFAAVNISLIMGDVVSFIVRGGSDWSGFIAAIGAFQVGKPGWSVRSGVQEFRATQAFHDPFMYWMSTKFNACHWENVTAASDSVEIGDGMSKTFPYWTNARYVWADNLAHGKTIFVRFRRGGHKCSE